MTGSYWFKTDLQVHTPVSPWEDFSFSEKKTEDEKRAWAKQLVASAQEKGVQLIALTEHNDGSYIDFAIEASKKSSLTVLPGVEITTQEGIHIIALFDPDRKIKTEGYSDWNDFIVKLLATLGVKGKTHESGMPVNAGVSALQVMEKIEVEGGITFFPHAFSHNGSAEAMTSDCLLGYATGQTKAGIYKHRLCRILQVPKKIEELHAAEKDIVTGRVPQYGNKKVACITTSDTRSFLKLGANNCWIKANPSFEGLKQIMYAPDERIFIGTEPPRYLYSQITKTCFSETELSSTHCLPTDTDITLSPNLTVVIGGRGTGKTTFLESIAYVFNETHSEGQRISLIDQTIDELEEKQRLGAVELEVQFGQNKNMVKRNFIHADDKPSIGFGIAYWKQGDIEEHAYSADKLRKLLQPLMTSNSVQALEEKISALLEEAISISEQYKQLPLLLQKRKDYREKLAQHKSILETVQDEKFQQLIREMKELSKEKNRVDSAVKLISECESEIATWRESTSAIEFVPTDWNKLLSDCGVTPTTTPEILFQTLESQQIALHDLAKSLISSKHYSETSQKLAEKQKEYTAVAQKLGVRLTQEQVEESSKQVVSIERELQRIEKQLEGLKASVTTHSQKTASLREARSQLATERSSIFTKISTELGSGVEIIDGEDFNEDDIAHIFAQYGGKPNLRVKEMAVLLKQKIGFDAVLTHLHERKVPTALAGLLEGTVDWFFASQEYSNRELLIMKLEELQPVFSPTISQNGKQLEELSFGERCALVLRIVLGYGTKPLLIDQPEDHLDNEFITKTLLDMLKERKCERQIILATHNPNIVVNGDAENVVILQKPVSPSKKCRLYQGGLEDKKVRNMIADILEGGEAAFKRREQRYEFK